MKKFLAVVLLLTAGMALGSNEGSKGYPEWKTEDKALTILARSKEACSFYPYSRSGCFTANEVLTEFSIDRHDDGSYRYAATFCDDSGSRYSWLTLSPKGEKLRGRSLMGGSMYLIVSLYESDLECLLAIADKAQQYPHWHAE